MKERFTSPSTTLEILKDLGKVFYHDITLEELIKIYEGMVK